MDQSTDLQRRRLQTSLALLLPALLFGFLVAAQWQTQQERSQLSVRYNTPLTEAAQALQNEQNALKVQLAELRAQLDALQSSTSTQSGTAKDLQARVDELKAAAGLTPVAGDGVVIVLDDAKGTSATARDLDKSICHATDLTDIVNTAWKGGAQAIAINEQRIVGSSSVYCVGSTIMVNGTLMSPPFNVNVIGPQDLILRAFDDPAQLRDIKQRRDVQGLGFRVVRSGALRAPAYDGPLTVRYATPR